MDDDANNVVPFINLLDSAPKDPWAIVISFVLANSLLAVFVSWFRFIASEFSSMFNLLTCEFIAAVCYCICHHSQELIMHHLGYTGMFYAILFQTWFFLSVNRRNCENWLIIMEESLNSTDNHFYLFLAQMTDFVAAVVTSFVLKSFNQLPPCVLDTLVFDKGAVKYPEIVNVLICEFLCGVAFHLLLRKFNRNHGISALVYAIVSTASHLAIGVFSAQPYITVFRLLNCAHFAQPGEWIIFVLIQIFIPLMGWMLVTSLIGSSKTLKSIWQLRFERDARRVIAAARARGREDSREEENDRNVPEWNKKRAEERKEKSKKKKNNKKWL